MALFNEILYWINAVLIGILSVAFSVQFIYTLFFWLPARKYKPAEKKHRVGIIIPARNESAVIGDTIRCLLASDYPRELFDIFVVADNCTDDTAEIAREAGAIVFEHFDDDPKHKKAGYALQFGFEKILESYDNYDFFIKFGWSYIDMFLNMLFVPIAVLCCAWVPLYYGYDIIYHYAVGNIAYGNQALINVAIILACAFVLPFVLQALLVTVLERKRIKASFKQMVPVILSFPLFMIIYAISITCGVFSKPKWNSVTRSTNTASLGLPSQTSSPSPEAPGQAETGDDADPESANTTVENDAPGGDMPSEEETK